MKPFFRFFLFFLLVAVVLAPGLAFAAQPLVPCGTAASNYKICDFCDLLELISRVIYFIAWELTPVAFVGLITYGGILYLTYGVNEGNRKKANSFIWTSIQGFLLIIFAWFIINTILYFLAARGENGKPSYQFLRKFQCPNIALTTPDATYSNPSATDIAIRHGQSSGIQPMSDAEIRAAVGRVESASYKTAVEAAAAKYGIPADRVKAIIVAESRGDANAQSGAGAIGLMQVLPSTARAVDPNLQGLSDTEVKNRLLNPSYNIDIGTKYYASLVREVSNTSKYNLEGGGLNEYDLASAAYNGGTYNSSEKKAALEPSTNCPGYYAFQCAYDNNEHTLPNVTFQETRVYLQNIQNVERAI